jgi:steroid 5-alpha reductase family enzyme
MDEPWLHAALVGLVPIVGLSLATWLASVARRDASLVDRMWGAFIASAALAWFAWLPAPGARGLAMLVLVVAWALRLGLYVTVRNWGHGEDRRYQQIRARNEPRFALKSLYLVFGLQAVLAWVVAAPFLAGMAAQRALGVLDFIGMALAAFGIVYEAIADAQMSRFRSDPAHRGQVMDRGLWRYSRHPNYFGEACIWWGFWMLALGGAGWAGAWTVVSPVLMTVLLLKVSGVSLLEKDIGERRPAYRDYVARTPAFIPGAPRRVRT